MIVKNFKSNDRVDYVNDRVDYGKRSFRSYQSDRVVLFKRWKKGFKFKRSC